MVRAKFKTDMEKRLNKLSKSQLVHLIQSVTTDEGLIKKIIENREHQRPKAPSFIEGCWDCKSIANIILN